MIVKEISGVRILESKVAREITQFIRDTESNLLLLGLGLLLGCSHGKPVAPGI